MPMDIPADFMVNLDSVNSTSAEFSWRSVDSSRQRVKGVFTGYQVNVSGVERGEEGADRPGRQSGGDGINRGQI